MTTAPVYFAPPAWRGVRDPDGRDAWWCVAAPPAGREWFGPFSYARPAGWTAEQWATLQGELTDEEG